QGGMSITFKFTGSSTKASDYKVNAVLMTQDKEEIEAKTFENTEDDTSAVIPYSNSSTNKTFSVVYSRSSSDKAEYLDSATYYLVFEVYDTRTGEKVPLNTSRNFVRVDSGITTTAELSLTLNEVYSITYYDNGGEFPEGAVVPFNYSRKSEGIDLPQMIKGGYKFEGWYNNEKFEGNSVSQISPGTTGNLTFWACFTQTDEP
nr:InlB B-repeat-containing protein [Treponema sp.]